MRLLISAMIALTLGADPVVGREFSAVCSNLSGVRVNDNGTRHAFTPDAVAGASWVYTWNVETKKAALTFPASPASGGRSHTQKGVVSFRRGGFFYDRQLAPGSRMGSCHLCRYRPALGDPKQH